MDAGKDRWERAVLLVLFLFSLSFLNLAGYLYPLAAAFVLLYRPGQLRISAAVAVLALFSVLYFAVYSIHYGLSLNAAVWYLLGPWSAWLMGKTFVERGGGPLRLLWVTAGGMWLHGVLNLWAYLRSGYFDQYRYYRQSVDFWRGALSNVNATGLLFTFAAALSAGALFSGVRPRRKLAAGLVLLGSVAASVFFANRALPLALLVILACCFLFGRRETGGRTRAILLAAAALAAIALLADVGEIASCLGGLKLVQRLLTDGGGARLNVWGEFFARWNFAAHPWGGGAMLKGSDFRYFHNLWLDVYNRTGLFPFLALAAATLCAAMEFFRFRRAAAARGLWDLRRTFTCVAAAAAVNCLLEPILEGNPYYFLILLMYLGAAEGVTEREVSPLE